MIPHHLDRRRWLLATAGLALAGCSEAPRSAPVEAAKARDALRAALESWKRGEKVEYLQSASPPIYVIDPEWQAGALLKEFKLVGDGTPQDANLLCPVLLTLRVGGRPETTREVRFVVSSAPNLTVSRKLF